VVGWGSVFARSSAYAAAILPSQKTRRFMLKARLAMPILALARAMPMVRTKPADNRPPGQNDGLQLYG